MTWSRKRKSPKVENNISAFRAEEQVNSSITEEVDWLNNMPNKRSVMSLEDVSTKCKRLQEEGAILAEAERYWESIQKFDESLSLNFSDAKVYDMKAQALSELHEYFPAVNAAEQAVKYDATWWVAYQTLGRALLNLGEVPKAMVVFQRAIRLEPTQEELWSEDLKMARELKRTLIDKPSESSLTKSDVAWRIRECMRVGLNKDRRIIEKM